jgi:hypothetical protein
VPYLYRQLDGSTSAAPIPLQARLLRQPVVPLLLLGAFGTAFVFRCSAAAMLLLVGGGALQAGVAQCLNVDQHQLGAQLLCFTYLQRSKERGMLWAGGGAGSSVGHNERGKVLPLK